MNSLAERFTKRLEEMGKNQSDVARAIGASPTAITKIATGETKRSRLLPEIAEYLKVSEQWLIYGHESNAERLDLTINEWDSNTQMPDDMVAVPYLKDMSLSAGKGALNGDLPYSGAVLWYAKSFIKRKNACPDAVFCITISGDSMEPVFSQGGIVMINIIEKEIVDGAPYAITYQDQDYIKYLRRMPDGKIRVVSENKEYPAFDANAEDVKIVGKVIEYTKEW